MPPDTQHDWEVLLTALRAQLAEDQRRAQEVKAHVNEVRQQVAARRARNREGWDFPRNQALRESLEEQWEALSNLKRQKWFVGGEGEGTSPKEE